MTERGASKEARAIRINSQLEATLLITWRRGRSRGTELTPLRWRDNPWVNELMRLLVTDGASRSEKRFTSSALRQLEEIGVLVPDYEGRYVRFSPTLDQFSPGRTSARASSAIGALPATAVRTPHWSDLVPLEQLTDVKLPVREDLWRFTAQLKRHKLYFRVDPDRLTRFPVLLSATDVATISSLKKRWRQPRTVREATCVAGLRAAGILADERAHRRQASAWRRARRESAQEFRETGTAVIRGLLTVGERGVLERYIRSLRTAGEFELDDEQVIGKRLKIHNEPLLRFVHHEIARTITLVAGELALPSYSYLTTYLDGAKLERHVDRPQCRWNVSLQLFQDPVSAIPWPLFVESAGKAAAHCLDDGDGFLYSGDRLPHWRNRIHRGQEATLVLLHFVDRDFREGLS